MGLPFLAESRILVVDDQPANVRLLERMLQQLGYTDVITLTNSRLVLPNVSER